MNDEMDEMARYYGEERMDSTSTAILTVSLAVIILGIGVMVNTISNSDDDAPEPTEKEYVKTSIDYKMDYKNTLHGEAYVVSFDAPADGYIVAHHGSTGWMEEHMMFHKGHNSLVIERYSSVGRPTIDFYVEA